jgi:hypothetical protein
MFEESQCSNAISSSPSELVMPPVNRELYPRSDKENKRVASCNF